MVCVWREESGGDGGGEMAGGSNSPPPAMPEDGSLSSPPSRLAWWSRVLLRGLLVTVNNFYCIPTYVVWVFLLSPLRLVAPSLFFALEGHLFYWLLTCVAFWSHSAGYQIVETGDSLDDLVDQPVLVIVNHQSTSDVPLLMSAFAARAPVLPRLNWIMDAVFKYTNFGIVSVLHGDFFINAGRDKRDASVGELVTYLSDSWLARGQKWLVLFPEGGFLRKRKETSNKYARKLGLPELVHVTLPRMGAMHAILETIGHSSSRGVKWVVDLTIAYPRGVPLDLAAVVTGCVAPCTVHFHYRAFPLTQVPESRRDLTGWLYGRYLEKEAMLGEFYAGDGQWRGVVPALAPSLVSSCKAADIPVGEAPVGGEEIRRRGSPKKVEHDLVRVALVHLFFILSSLLHLAALPRLLPTLK